jgi:hypothetical protein
MIMERLKMTRSKVAFAAGVGLRGPGLGRVAELFQARAEVGWISNMRRGSPDCGRANTLDTMIFVHPISSREEQSAMVRKGSEAERASTMSPASAFAIRFTSGGEAPSLIFLSTRIVPAIGWVYSTDSLRVAFKMPPG